MAHARADEHRGPLRHSAVDEEPPVLGQADRGDPAVLHATHLHGPLHRQERGLAHVNALLDDVVDIGEVGGTHDAGRDALLAGALTGYQHAVPGRLRIQVIMRVEGVGVGVGRVDGHHLRLTSQVRGLGRSRLQRPQRGGHGLGEQVSTLQRRLPADLRGEDLSRITQLSHSFSSFRRRRAPLDALH